MNGLVVPAQPKILGLGVVVIDHILSVPTYPLPDTKNEATNSFLQIGGPVPTALSHLRNLGWHTHFLSVWGDDAFGSLIETRLQTDGVRYQSVCREDIETPVTQVWLEETTGRRTLVTHRPTEHNIAQRITTKYVSQFNVLHLDCWPPEESLRTAQLMKSNGGLVCLDTGSPKETVAQLLPLADIVNCPKRFCEMFCNTTSLEAGAKAVAKHGPQIVTVTDGENGAVMLANGKIIHQPAYQNTHVVDSNGAGDIFTAGLIHGVLRQWSPAKTLKYASAIAACGCGHIGNAAKFKETDVQRFIQNQ